MQPLKITFTFCTPVVRETERPMHLDGLLAWAVSEDAEAFGSDNPWRDADDLSHVLERHDPPGNPEQWVWKASALKFTAAGDRYFANMVRTADPEAFMHAQDNLKLFDARRPRSYFDTQSGPDRAYQLLVPFQWMAKCEAWCIGDEEGVRELLAKVPGIGKQTRNGYGAISSVTVERDEEAASKWRLRSLPIVEPGPEGAEYLYTLTALRAPYWKKTSWVHAKEPILL
jgi:CRISPR type IV-associated protein Csf3